MTVAVVLIGVILAFCVVVNLVEADQAARRDGHPRGRSAAQRAAAVFIELWV